MKKLITALLIFLTFNAYSQHSNKDFDSIDAFINYYVNSYIYVLGKKVPEDYIRLDRTTYKNNEEIFLTIDNNLVIISAIGSSFRTTNAALEFNGHFYNFFEENLGFQKTLYNKSDIYEKNGFYAMILRPTKRDDGLIVAMIAFSNDINKLQ